MNKQEEQTINNTYTTWLRTEKTAAQQVGWTNNKDQTSRFEQLLKLQSLVGSFCNNSILEVGCGDGALSNFLKQKLKGDFWYTGVDFNAEYIKRARTQHREFEFVHENFLAKGFSGVFDVILASGIFNVDAYDSQERRYKVLFDTLTKMLAIATKGIAFNFLSRRDSPTFVLSNEMIVYDKNKVLDWIKKTTPSRIEVIEGYDPVDTTILVKR